MPARAADARWEGDLQSGTGAMKVASGAFEGAYSFTSRFEDPVTGTNPEELIAAAHAGCFSMALSAALGRAGTPPEFVETNARVHLERGEQGFQIARVSLNTRAKVPGIDDKAFQEAAQGAKQNCPVSKALAAVEITLEASLVS